jgi:hypothetical protein
MIYFTGDIKNDEGHVSLTYNNSANDAGMRVTIHKTTTPEFPSSTRAAINTALYGY